MEHGQFSHQDLSSTATKIHVSEKGDGLIILASTWDGKIESFRFNPRYSQVQRLTNFSLTKLPILGMTALDNKVYYTHENEEGKSQIYELDLHPGDNKSAVIGSCPKPINHLIALDDNLLCSFSWDRTCRIWDIREGGKKSAEIMSHELPASVIDVKREDDSIMGVLSGDKFFKMSATDPFINPEFFELQKERKEKSYISCIAINPFKKSEDDFCVGTCEGRIMHCTKNYNDKEANVGGRWKSHCYEKSVYFQINAIAYHTTWGELVFTGGRDGKVTFHEVLVSREYQSLAFDDPLPVTHIDVSKSGGFMVVAKGNGWHPDPKRILLNEKNKAKICVYSFVGDDFRE